MLSLILVPLDGSAFAEAAIEPARRIAEQHEASLEFVTVHQPELPVSELSGTPSVDPRFEAEMLRAQRQYLERVVAAARQRGPASASGVFLEGNVARELVRQIERGGAGLVVMTTHGHGGLERLWLGSIADRVVRETHVPVLLVRGAPDGEGAPDLPRFRRIVIALGGVEDEQRVIDATMLITDRERATYTLLHVATITNLLPAAALGVPMMPGEGSALPPTVDEAALAQARRYLERLAAPLRAAGVAVDCDVAVGGSVARAILDYARTTRADLVALATHAHAPLTRAVLGSVADKVMRSADASVLVVPPARKR